MVTKIVRALLLFTLLGTSAAFAATFNISAGASASTIQNTINSAASAGGSNTVQFAAGVYNVAWQAGGSTLNVPCPAGPLIITGPTTTYDQPGVLNAWAARPTAIIRNTNTGASFQLISLNGCSTSITLQYLEIDGGQPQTGGGSIYFNGVNLSNVTIQYNWLHGNQEITPVLCGNPADWCYDDNRASIIEMDGFHGDQNGIGSVAANITIDHNIFGKIVPGNVAAGDCGNVMTFVGGCTNNLPGCPNWDGYNNTGSFCTALYVHTNTNNLHFDWNSIQQQEQGTKWVEGGNGVDTGNSGCKPQNPNGFFCDGIYSLFFQFNDSMLGNDVGPYQRIGTEDQQSSVNSNPLNGLCTEDGFGNCMIHRFNDFSGNQPNPSFGSWAWSLPNHGYHRDDDNLVISNTNTNGSAGPGDWEEWTDSSENNNLDQGYNACASQFGGNNPSATVNNNIFEMVSGASCDIAFGINNAQNITPPVHTNNSGSATPTKHTSGSPSYSPNGGTFSSSVAVTLTDTGLSGSQGPEGNTGIWCTTDGSTPAPKAGTSIYYPTGYVLTLTSTTTLKCVGMWGAQNQPASYISGYGFQPSSVVSATFTGGGAPTTAGVVFSPASENITGSTNVTLTSATSGASIFYCTTPGCTATPSSTLYTSPITVAGTTTISAIATASGFANSPVTSATYTLVSPGQAATPTFSPGAPLTFTNNLTVTIASSTPTPTIYYTTDGTTPTPSSSVYSGPITVSSTQTLKAIATATGFTTSNVGSATYTFALFLGNNSLDNSTANTYPGAFNGIYAVTAPGTGGFTITGCVVNQGTAAVTLGSHTACVVNLASSPTTQAANALCSGFYTNTSTTGAVANITMTGCPTILNNQGYFISSITDDPLQPSGLGFSDCGNASTGCTGGVPTLGVGTYASFYFAGTYGTYTGMTTSLNKGIDQVTQYLTLAPAITTTATPVISPTAGIISNPATISIADTTPSSTIYYTTDGSTPTTSSTVYTTPFSISTSTTVKAIATAAGMANSGVASNNYVLSTGSLTQEKFAYKSGLTYVAPGSVDNISVNITYSDGFKSNLSAVGTRDVRNTVLTSYSSSNTGVATIANDGTITGVSNTVQPNTTIITAVLTDSTGTTYTITVLEGCAFSLTAGIE